MKSLKVILLALIFALTNIQLSALGKSDEMVIELQAPDSLLSLYFDAIHVDSEIITQDHANDLQRVALFDLNNNGKMRTLNQSEVPEYKKNRSASEWRALGASYVISAWIREQYLTFSVFSSEDDKVCFAEDIKLTGNLNKDRQKIHVFVNNLHKDLFGEDGIYLNKILYTFKTRNVSDPYYATVSEEVYQCDWDGANTKQMTFEKSHCVSPHPVMSKNGEQIEGFFYVSYKIGQPKIFWNKFGEKNAQRLCYIPGNQFMPCMSPKGDKVVFISDAPGNPEIFLQDFKPGVGSVGKPRQIFACKRGVQASPIFSPDGNRVAFVSDKEGSPRIYVMDIPKLGASSSDLKPVLLTKVNRENTKPSWSPDGTKLAYIAKVDGVRQVWIYDFITNQEWQLTHGNSNKENPYWAQNSLHLIFNSVGNESCELYMVNLNQPKSVRIKTEAGVKRFPIWVK
ncbi:MAG: Tol-Pal system protein TolB [Chlamydiae bacterium]|nr:Tol-Pal system protein TolB [Chlamydiota bacterium]